MSPVPIFLAFAAAMALFVVWVYFEVRESLRRDVARLRTATVLEPSPRPEPVRLPEPRPARRRAVVHAAGFAMGVLLLLRLAFNASREVPVAGR